MVYRCLDCRHLAPSNMDLLECGLQTVRYLKEDRSSWARDPVCLHDSDLSAAKYQLSVVLKKDIANYDSEHNITDRFEAK